MYDKDFTDQPTDVSLMQYGWICPKCGAVMSPFTSYCLNCTEHKLEFTCATGSIDNVVNNAEEPYIHGK